MNLLPSMTKVAPRLALLLGLLVATPGAGTVGAQSVERFVVVDVFIDAGAVPLAAYQAEIMATPAQGASARLAGVEGGEPAAFRAAPYYDPAALRGGRVVLGAFSVAAPDQLPRGPARVASLHWHVLGPGLPQFQVKPVTAATSNGQPVPIKIELKERKEP